MLLRPLFTPLAGFAALLCVVGCGNSAVPDVASVPPAPAPAPAPGTPPVLGTKKLTVVVAVVDSLMPQEITATTPNLDALKSEGTFYTESRAIFSAETIPNHVAMMTGVNPARSGIATNNFIDFLDPLNPVERDLSLPEELAANTLFTWVDRKCRVNGLNPDIKTGATLSKKYLFEVFQGDAFDAQRANRNAKVFNVPPDSHWDPTSSPAYIGPGFEYTPDAPTMQQALTQLPEADFFFVSLGDVDRFAHALGTAARSAALLTADAQIGRLRTALEDAGRWENTVMIVTSDHGTDIATNPFTNGISTQGTLDALAGCFTPMTAVQNGGSDSLYVMDRSLPLAQRQAALRAARACLIGTTDCATLCPGATRPANAAQIAGAWYTQDDAADPEGSMPASLVSRHPNLGDLVLVAARGFKFSEPDASGNPIPGNHGHPVTFRNVMLVSGGSPWVKKGQVIAASTATPSDFDRLPEQAENIDITPTVAWLLGLNIQPGDFPEGAGFDGRILDQAFSQFDTAPNAAAPTVCGRFS
ncbi:alkaline phosphatase family protein [Stagnimonas aquatica]|nr:alkaline phosphatase family protein [Stagnimonas aquatica]